MVDFKKKNDYITLIDSSLSSLKELIFKVSGKGNYSTVLDFSSEKYKLSVKDISSKFQFLDGVTLFSSISNKLAPTLEINEENYQGSAEKAT